VVHVLSGPYSCKSRCQQLLPANPARDLYAGVSDRRPFAVSVPLDEYRASLHCKHSHIPFVSPVGACSTRWSDGGCALRSSSRTHRNSELDLRRWRSRLWTVLFRRPCGLSKVSEYAKAKVAVDLLDLFPGCTVFQRNGCHISFRRVFDFDVAKGIP